MTRGFYRGYLALLAALILFSLSPLAALGGLVVVFVIVIPVGIMLEGLGLLQKGSAFDGQLTTLLWGLTAFLVLIALGLAYRAASYHELGDRAKARALTALSATAVTVPVVIYFCYTALQI